MATPRVSDKKTERFAIRTTSAEKALVERAARLSNVNSSQFVLQAALRKAEQIVADQTRFTLPPDRWNEFVAALDRPPHPNPRLKKAAAKPSAFGEY
jgi:uncharacterized protein (DUF1778 family)